MRGVLWLEVLWDASWPAGGLVLGYAALSLFDVWAILPPLMHAALLAATAGAVIFTLVRSARVIERPTRADAIRRLEAASALAHRPLETVDDTLAAGAQDPATRALWLGAQQRAAAALARLKTAGPRSRLAARDPHALRFAALLMTVLGIALAGPDSWNRIAAGLTPSLARHDAHPAALDAWIDPPAYTGLAPLFLARGPLNDTSDTIPSVPQGSRLTMRLHGSFSRARLEIKAPGHAQHASTTVKLAAEDGGTHAATVDLDTTSEVVLRNGGRVLGRWPINVTPDTPPVIAFDGEVKATTRAALRVPYSVYDDFGIKAVELQIRVANKPDSETLHVPLSVPSQKGTPDKPARMRAFEDLSAHPWAGIEVEMTLVARDAKGQEGASQPVTLVLPERPFHHPLARALVDARRHLALEDDGIDFAAGFLDTATSPQAPDIEMTSVILALRLAYRQLTTDATPEAIASASDLMWNAALALERGIGEDAERDLQAAKDALAKALRENASQDEIAEKMQALRDALNRYLDTLAQQFAQDGNYDRNAPVDPNAQVITPEDFASMLEALENLAQTGANEEAEKLLGALDDILQNLQAPRAPQEPSPQDKARQQAMSELGDIIGDQRKLMDDTHRKNNEDNEDQPGFGLDQPFGDGGDPAPQGDAQAGGRGGEKQSTGRSGDKSAEPGAEQGSGDGEQNGGGSLADRQGDLRGRLGSAMEALGEGSGEVPSALGRAEQAMKDAQKALRDGNRMGALQSQKEALEALRDGAQSIAKAMDNANRQARGMSSGFGRASSDPFGRPIAGTPDLNSALEMPDKGEIQRAREILNEIRRRAAERGRPQNELDYLDRLLERF